MIRLNIITKSALALALLSLAGCSNQATKPEPVDTAATVETPTATDSSSTWEQAYGEPQESSENELSPSTHYPSKLPKVVKQPKPITDVWERIRQGYEFLPEQLHQDTQAQLDWFVKHPEYVNRVVERARPYLHHIVAELDKRDMPLELALLPVVESGFQPFAVSSSKAAGIWQFIPGTGKVYGLKQDWWYDGRRDVIASTSAAIRYLQKLHNDFGDWQLALAAYNCGEGTVGRAIKRNKRAGKPTDFWSLDLPKETSAYVPKLLAVSHMVKYAPKYDIALSPIDNKPYLASVDVGGQIDMALAAKLAGISTDEMYQLNPGFSQFATSPTGPHHLVVPVNKAEQFEAVIATLDANERVTWTRHKIKQGESLGKIAQQYHTTTTALKQANNLKNSFIRAGKNLLIPTGKSYIRSAKASTDSQQAPSGKSTLHTVKPGDTWWDIANNYNTDVNKLTQWNKRSPKDVLQPGQKLIVWTPKSTSDAKNTITYTIKAGDSLWKVSRKFNVTVSELREWNGLSQRSLLQPGQSITLYVNANPKYGNI